MKKIQAIIRKTRFEDVKEALYEANIEWFSYMEVRGVGMARQERVYRGLVYDTSYIERYMLTIIVREVNVDLAINAILNSARTGEIGDGRIFVSGIDECYSIRTGLAGDKTLFASTNE